MNGSRIEDKKARTIIKVVVIAILLYSTLSIAKVYAINQNTDRFKESMAAAENGVSFGEVVPFSYDRVYVFDPYQSKNSMEEAAGLSYHGLRESVSEGMINILFVKNGRPMCYVYGYPDRVGFSLWLGANPMEGMAAAEANSIILSRSDEYDYPVFSPS